MTSHTDTATPPVAIAYCRVSTHEQGSSGLGLDAQAATLMAEAARQGWELRLVTEVASGGKDPSRRPVLAEALADLDAGRAQVLMVAKLDRATRSLLDAVRLIDRADRKGWRFLSVDTGVDSSTVAGKFIVQLLAVAAEMGRGRIQENTVEALAAKKRQGHRLGRPVVLPDATRQRIAALHADGVSMRAIARTLTAEAVPTARGGAAWSDRSVAAVLRSLACDAETAAIRAALVA